MKKSIVLVAMILALSLALTASAEYVPCLTEGEEHTMSEWTVVQRNEADGTTSIARTCSKCGYVQQGIAPADWQEGDDLSSGVATTLSAPLAPDVVAELPVATNPSTGARA